MEYPQSFERLIRKKIQFHGLNNNYIKLNNHIFKLNFDQENHFATLSENNSANCIFSSTPIDAVLIESDDQLFDGYYIYDNNNNLLLTFGVRFNIDIEGFYLVCELNKTNLIEDNNIEQNNDVIFI